MFVLKMPSHEMCLFRSEIISLPLTFSLWFSPPFIISLEGALCFIGYSILHAPSNNRWSPIRYSYNMYLIFKPWNISVPSLFFSHSELQADPAFQWDHPVLGRSTRHGDRSLLLATGTCWQIWHLFIYRIPSKWWAAVLQDMLKREPVHFGTFQV